MNDKLLSFGRAVFWSASTALLLGAGACSFLVDSKAEQCESDADCSALGAGVKCGEDKVCIQSSTGGAGGGTTSSGGGGTGGEMTGGGGTGTTTSTPTETTAPTCASPDSPPVSINGDITSDFKLTCNQVYLLEGPVRVAEGATLTIEKGTTIKAKYVDSKDPNNVDKFAVLVIEPGSKLIAVGTPDEPIVFTSSQPEATRKPGDWGGIILLGNAPTNHKDAMGQPAQGKIEGLATTGGLYGGINPDDNSGTLKYLRIEYGGYAIAPNNEVNGLTFGGVGRGTVVDHIQVRQTADDCFEFFGGAVNAKYLACQYTGDDGFDWDNGYSGKLQFLVLQQDPAIADDCNGFEGDNDATGSENTPVSNPTIYNATLIGQNGDTAKTQIGILPRRSTKASMFNILVTGFETGWDPRDAKTAVVLQNSLFFGNLVNNIAEPEPTGGAADDDAAFDEEAYFLDAANKNSTQDPKLVACFDADSPVFGPMTSLTSNAATPPTDGFFDSTAKYVGAFKDANDTWATDGKWAVWSSK
ncbi:MAG: hypothetical protein R3B70_19235 [Polyangiaceae bacterium]